MEYLPDLCTCDGCKFWQQGGFDYQPQRGLCRRHAPTGCLANPYEDPDGVLRGTHWPATDSTDTCGDYEQRR